MLFPATGPAGDLLHRIKTSHALRRSRIQVRGKGNCTKLIVGIGQVHPVLTGRFERFQARRIANVQAEIFAICRYMNREYDVTAFGQEGLSGRGKQYRLPENMLRDLKNAAGDRHGVKRLLRTIASKWRRSLHRSNTEKIEAYSTALNGLALLQALDAGVTMFPIEQEDIHSAVGKAITTLQAEFKRIEASAAYQSVIRKGGKGLTKQEYEASVTRNALVKQFNAALMHPERDRAILREVLKYADTDLTVFVLGTGHRSRMLTLAARNLPEGYLFVWVTPPSLWWWYAVTRRIGWTLLLLLLLAMVMALRTT